jgi:hypothetical protein
LAFNTNFSNISAILCRVKLEAHRPDENLAKADNLRRFLILHLKTVNNISFCCVMKEIGDLFIPWIIEISIVMYSFC